MRTSALKVGVCCILGIEWTREADKVHREPDDTFGGSVGCQNGQPVCAMERYSEGNSEEKAVKFVFLCVCKSNLFSQTPGFPACPSHRSQIPKGVVRNVLA